MRFTTFFWKNINKMEKGSTKMKKNMVTENSVFVVAEMIFHFFCFIFMFLTIGWIYVF